MFAQDGFEEELLQEHIQEASAIPYWRKRVRQVASAQELVELIQDHEYIREQVQKRRQSFDSSASKTSIGQYELEDNHKALTAAIGLEGRHFNSFLVMEVGRYHPLLLLAHPDIQAPQTTVVLKQLVEAEKTDTQKLLTAVMIGARRHTLDAKQDLADALRQAVPRRRYRHVPASSGVSLQASGPSRQQAQVENPLLEVSHMLQDGCWQGQTRDEIGQQINKTRWKKKRKANEDGEFPLDDKASKLVVSHPMARLQDLRRVAREMPTWSVGRVLSQKVRAGHFSLMEAPEIRKTLVKMARHTSPKLTPYVLPVLMTSEPEDFPDLWSDFQDQDISELVRLIQTNNLQPQQIARLGKRAVQQLTRVDNQQIRQRAIQASGHLSNLKRSPTTQKRGQRG